MALAEAHLVDRVPGSSVRGARPDRPPDPRRRRTRDRRGRRGRPPGRPRSPRRDAHPAHDAPPRRRHHPDLLPGPRRRRDPARDLPRSVHQPAASHATGTRDQQLQPAGDPVARLSYPKRMGQAFVQLLESLDPTRLPIHGGDATTLVVTIALDALKADLATADLIGAGLVPGDDLTGDGSPPPRPAGWRAPRRSCPSSSAARASPSTSAAPAPLQPGPAQGPAGPRPDLPRRGLRRPRHLVRGPPPPPLAHRRARPTSPTASCSAATTTIGARREIPGRSDSAGWARPPPLPPAQIGQRLSPRRRSTSFDVRPASRAPARRSGPAAGRARAGRASGR